MTKSARNQAWQQAQREQGRCTTCAKPAAPFARCKECRAKRARYNAVYNRRYKLSDETKTKKQK